MSKLGFGGWLLGSVVARYGGLHHVGGTPVMCVTRAGGPTWRLCAWLGWDAMHIGATFGHVSWEVGTRDVVGSK